jgi:DNA-binding NarL/FixJ family response regulator
MHDIPRSLGFTVVVGDANPEVRSALRDLIDDHPQLHLQGSGSNGDETIHLCATYRPHLAVVELMSSSLGPVHDAIRIASPSTIVAVFTARADRRTQERLLASGVHAVFSKGIVHGFGDALLKLMASSRIGPML